jgi:hypothetical protein
VIMMREVYKLRENRRYPITGKEEKEKSKQSKKRGGGGNEKKNENTL